MKRRVLGLLLFLLIVPLFMACNQDVTTTETATTQTTVETTEGVTTEATTVDLSLGTVTIEIKTVGDNPDTTEVEENYISNSVEIKFYEDEMLFDILLANLTISCGDESGNPDGTCSYSGLYGHYLTSIDTLIPTEANQYISLLINGQYAMTGVDTTPLNDGDVFTFEIGTF